MLESPALAICDEDQPPPVKWAPATELGPGAIVGGGYRLDRCLGRGGMGDIHVASHPDQPGEVVVKVLSPELTVNDEAMARFRQEAMAMASIHHPNVVRLLDFNFTADARPYLVMEYLPGKNLGDLLMTGTFTVPEVSAIVRQVASALEAAHALRIVHRDLKPENIMIVPREGRGPLVKVIDFGICKAPSFNHLTSQGMVMGTPEFMSPEQAEGRQAEVEAHSDQFALSVITYLLLAGRMPWVATTTEEFLHCAVHQYPLALTDDGAFRAIEAVLFRAMAKAPADRYPSILAYAEALDAALIECELLPKPALRPGETRAEVQPPVRRPETRAWQRRRGIQAGWAAMALMVLIFGVCLASTPAGRNRAGGEWNRLRGFAARHATRGATESHRLALLATQGAVEEGQHLLSVAAHGARATLALGTGL